MNYLRRGIALLVGMLLLASTFPAFAAPGDKNLFIRDEAEDFRGSPDSIAVLGDKLFLSTYRGLYAYQVGEASPQEVVSYDTLSQEETLGGEIMLLGGDPLRVMSVPSGKLGTLKDQTIIWDGAIDIKDLQPPEEEGVYMHIDLSSPVLDGESAFMLLRDPQGDAHQIVRFDLAKGTYDTLALEDVVQISPYQPGKLLVVQYDWMGSADSPAVSIVDGQSGKVVQVLSPLKSYSDGALAYDAATDSIYAIIDSQIVKLVDNIWQPVAYIPLRGGNNVQQAAMLAGGYYVACSWDGVYIRNTDPQFLADQPLKILGYGMDEQVSAFMRANPDIPVVLQDGHVWGGEELQRTLSDPTVDIIFTDATSGVWPLMEKGYLADLSQTPLMDSVKQMYAPIQSATMHNDKLYAYPLALDLECWSVRPKLLEAAGFDHLPGTFVEMLEMMGRWEAEKDESSEIRFWASWGSESNSMRDELIRTAFDLYIAVYELPDTLLSFDTPAFRALMEGINALPFEYQSDERMGSLTIYIDEVTKNTMFNTFSIHAYSIFNSYENNPEAPEKLIPIPPLTEGAQPVTPASLRVAILNPISKNQENALKLLNYLDTHQEAANDRMFYPEHNEPVEHEWYQESLKASQEHLAGLKERLTNAEDVDRRTLEDEIAEMEKWLGQDGGSDRWQISPEKLANYREVAQYIRIGQNSQIERAMQGTGGREVYDILYSFIEGTIDLDTLVARLDRVMTMIYQE